MLTEILDTKAKLQKQFPELSDTVINKVLNFIDTEIMSINIDKILTLDNNPNKTYIISLDVGQLPSSKATCYMAEFIAGCKKGIPNCPHIVIAPHNYMSKPIKIREIKQNKNYIFSVDTRYAVDSISNKYVNETQKICDTLKKRNINITVIPNINKISEQ
jgi:hypothetical protein